MTHRRFIPRKRLLPLAIASTALAPFSMTAQAQSERGMELDPVVVSATRSETSVSETARSVTVVDRKQVEQQAKVSRNLADLLEQTVPGMGPSSDSMSNFGQTMRGTSFLVLIDGIPQSTPLRDGARGLNSISTSAIEKIEVIRGGTAVYGFGAKGGVINIITKKAGKEPVEGYSEAGVRFSTEHFDDSLDYETEHRVSGTRENWDYVLSGSFVERGGRFDSEGDRIPPGGPGGTQGGFSDTTEYNLLAKTGYNFDGGDQRLELMFNRFDNEQDSDYTIQLPGGAGKATAVRAENASGDARVFNEPKQEATSVRGTYLNRDVYGSSLNIDVYYGDTAAGYPRYPGFDQSQIESEKVGLRSTIETPIDQVWDGGSISWGVDYLDSKTLSKYFDGTGLASPTSPELEQKSKAVFGQLELPVADSAVIRGGARYEDIDIDTTTVENRFGNTVEGGSVDYEEFLFNVGAVYFVTETLDVFANFSQGFSVGDLGRQIRDANPSADPIGVSFFKEDAEETNQYETGLRYSDNDLSWSAAAFYIDYKNGRTYNDALQIEVSDQEIWGLEGSVDYQFSDAAEAGGTFTWSEGRKEENGGTEWLPGTRISPLKLTGYFGHETTAAWSNRFQVTHISSRDRFGDSTAYPEGEVKHYTLVDYIGTVEYGPGEATIAVNNLLNRDYYPALGQAYNTPGGRIKGQGRTVGLGYSVNW